jgi:imidazolonepropionase-like amidohydrolase
MEATHRAKIDLVRRMHDAGVGFLAGTDVSNWNFTVPGASLHSELQWFTEAGLTPLEALQTATLNPAKYLGIENSSGTVEVGKRADLLVLDADPTERIANARRISAVVLSGRLVDRNELDRILDGARKRAVGVPRQ